MGVFKEIFINRTNHIIALYRKMSSYRNNEIFDKWVAMQLPTEDDSEELFTIVSDDAEYNRVVCMASELLYDCSQSDYIW